MANLILVLTGCVEGVGAAAAPESDSEALSSLAAAAARFFSPFLPFGQIYTC